MLMMTRNLPQKNDAHGARRIAALQADVMNTDGKGRKHEAFESGSFGVERRSLAHILVLDKKR
ncbi:hypothetical protein [Pelomonas sp. KK5]|uniref:hypothetical protein n=1 Tax=Pelomonas sp. KK5 TaxID=1855730 RepID=UPI00097C0787|nr:hypothetical protein [Pelomonas sp. KK5]